MKRHLNPIATNPLKTREDMQLAVNQLCLPLRPYYSAGGARLRLGETASGCPAETAELEGFSRVLWGLAPLAAGGGESGLWETVRAGIKNGTNPEHPEYWGLADDYDQKLVEMAAIGHALALAPGELWVPLTEAERSRLVRWLGQINERKLHDCNWLLFHVVVNLGLEAVGQPCDEAGMQRNLDRLDDYYKGEGWYADGPNGHCDYYGPLAIHYGCLLYAARRGRRDPERAARYRERAAAFARTFIHWFAEDGSALPYGRSLTYRFAQAAFWSALAYAGVEPYPPGVMKGIVLRHLRWWFDQPIFEPDGTLAIGYAYPNLVMAENYNAPGSPYWAFKTFLPLALPADHPFWLAEELPLPALAACAVQAAPRMIVHRQADRQHVAAFNAGHSEMNEHTHASAKYEKFAYSTAFGFSVPRAEWGLTQGAFDSMLALSEGDNLYRVKRATIEHAVDGRVVYARWLPWRDVEVRTWLITGAPWHVRVHRIRSERALEAADGGFALGIDQRRGGSGAALQASEAAGTAVAVSGQGASGIVALAGGGSARLVYPNANTNLLHARTVLPTVTASIPPGDCLLVTAVYGQPGGASSMADWHAVPVVVETDGALRVQLTAPGSGDAAMKEQDIVTISGHRV